jgi:hypothetical protein
MKPKTVATLFLAGGMLFLIAAILPLRRGESVNVARLLVAGALVVLAPIVAKKSGTNSNPPAA